MAKFETKQELIDAVLNEGGIVKAIINEGMHSDVLPENTPEDIIFAWDNLYETGADWANEIGMWLYGDES